MSRTSDRRYLRNRKKIRNLDTCWLCGQWIDPDLKSPHPHSWSADHVNPVSTSHDNHGPLKPAHRICNQKRKAKPAPIQHGRAW